MSYDFEYAANVGVNAEIGEVTLAVGYNISMDDGDYWNPSAVELEISDIYLFEDCEWEGEIIPAGTYYHEFPAELQAAFGKDYTSLRWDMRADILSEHDCADCEVIDYE